MMPEGLGVYLCSDVECDGTHVIVVIGDQGQPEKGRHITDAAGARNIAAMLCTAAGVLEGRGCGPKLN